MSDLAGCVFDIQRWSLHDGPGIRTVVFLKGCPLQCVWCCNPESQLACSEMAFFPDKCIGCMRCVKNCPHGAITVDGGTIRTDWSICRETCYRSGQCLYPCTLQCYATARRNVGCCMTVEQVLDEVLRDSLIYQQSGGGVTVSGGEPMAQVDFVEALFARCRERWVHTAMETSGAAPWEDYERVLGQLDFLFLDLKHMDPNKHRELVGVDNSSILENARRLARTARARGIKMVVRLPVVPGLNDDEENVKATADFVAHVLDGVKVLELMPYHRLGRGKYRDIGRSYPLMELEPPSREHVEHLQEIIEAHGLKTTYV